MTPENDIHRYLVDSMALYRALPDVHQRVVVEFVDAFCGRVEFFVSPKLSLTPRVAWLVAGQAALVGAAQQTDCFSCVRWVYLDSVEDTTEQDGSARGYSSVRLNAEILIEESATITYGANIAVHEFAHVLDYALDVTGNSVLLFEEFQNNQSAREHGAAFCIDDGEGEEGEFFAYATELFFTAPQELKTYRPRLYQWLASTFGLDMVEVIGTPQP